MRRTARSDKAVLCSMNSTSFARRTLVSSKARRLINLSPIMQTDSSRPLSASGPGLMAPTSTAITVIHLQEPMPRTNASSVCHTNGLGRWFEKQHTVTRLPYLFHRQARLWFTTRSQANLRYMDACRSTRLRPRSATYIIGT